jgi:hypothetical protein
VKASEAAATSGRFYLSALPSARAKHDKGEGGRRPRREPAAKKT